MGTNYYHRYNACAHCGRYDERHIGKHSMGWQFSFRGHAKSDEDWNQTIIIGSWEQWKEALKEGKIFDEYRREISLDDFIAMIERSRGKKNHYDYLRDDPRYGSSYLSDMWKDTEGWDFTSVGFS
jgi:hypothetical protein